MTYGEDVNWYRNIVAAGDASWLSTASSTRSSRSSPTGPMRGLRAFGGAKAVLLQLLRRREFRLLHRHVSAGRAGGPDGRLKPD
ncbi:hypothetical protein [Agrococcus citreus]